MITFRIQTAYGPLGAGFVAQGARFDDGQVALDRLSEGRAVETFPSFDKALRSIQTEYVRPVEVFWEHGAPWARKEQTRLIAALPGIRVAPEREYNIYRDDPEDQVLALGHPDQGPLYHVCLKDRGGWIEDQATGVVDQREGRTAAQVVDAILALFPGVE